MTRNPSLNRSAEHSSHGSDGKSLQGGCAIARGFPPESAHPVELSQTAPDEMVESVIRQLNALCKAATLDFALAVGGLIIANLYAGDLKRWRMRNPRKEHSLRKLAKHPNLPLSPSALYRSVAIFELCERLEIRCWKHVSTTHVRIVLPLPLDSQERLLRAAEANRWSARRLEDEAAALMRSNPSLCPSRGGRKRRPRFCDAVQSVERAIATLNGLSMHDDVETQPSPDSARAAIEVLRGLTQTCRGLEHRLTTYLIDLAGPVSAGIADDREAHEDQKD